VRILHVAWGFHPLRTGGLSLYTDAVVRAQLAGGHAVGLFCSGRQYRRGPRDVLVRWRRRSGLRVFEVVSSTLPYGLEAGTRSPLLDLDHAPTERAFARALRALAPEVVHVQELGGLPSSLLDVARAHGVPVVFTPHDYALLCPTIKLLDADGRVCRRDAPGAMCRVCCADAPAGPHPDLLALTREHDLTRWVPARVRRRARRVRRRLIAGGDGAGAAAAAPAPAPPLPLPPAADYDRRRRVDVERLNRVDVLVAQSAAVARVYEEHGVGRGRFRSLRATRPDTARIAARAITEPPRPVVFVTLNGCATVPKGARVVAGALERLDARGLRGSFRLVVLGHVGADAERALAGRDDVEVRGPYAPGELGARLAGCHVGIVPSVWDETWGYVGPELLSAGLPVIGNARGAIPEYVVEGQTGWLNHAADAGGLADLMAGVIAAPEQIVALNARIRAHGAAPAGDFAAHVRALAALYAEAIAG